MPATHPGNVVLEVEKILCKREVEPGVKVIRAGDGYRWLVVILGGSVHACTGKSEWRMRRGNGRNSIVAQPNLIKEIRLEDVCLGQRGHQIVQVICRGSAGQIAATRENIRRITERGKKPTLDRVLGRLQEIEISHVLILVEARRHTEGDQVVCWVGSREQILSVGQLELKQLECYGVNVGSVSGN